MSSDDPTLLKEVPRQLGFTGNLVNSLQKAAQSCFFEARKHQLICFGVQETVIAASQSLSSSSNKQDSNNDKVLD